VRSVFEDAYQYMKSGTLLRQVINKINEAIDFNKTEDRHLFGEIYEQILRDLQSAGNAGEYYTPRAVTQFMVDMVDPQLGEKLLDPACGTGGFLTFSIEHVRQHYLKTPADEQTLQKSIRGAEKKPLPHLLCTTNMLLHGIDIPSQIRHDNTLARPLRDYGPKDSVDAIVTNPPFGGMEEGGIETNFPKAVQTRETADLFLVLIFAPEKKWWKKRKENEQAWKVPVEQIKAAGYNLDMKNPHDAGLGHADPTELLAGYQRLLGDLQQTRDRLKQELRTALEGH
ncbi:MAG: N-6 DNA methylase, partial [Planctomycetes bacterium]|nr:N-6 DNA methylase [Planctomycetota bacterium]